MISNSFGSGGNNQMGGVNSNSQASAGPAVGGSNSNNKIQNKTNPMRMNVNNNFKNNNNNNKFNKNNNNESQQRSSGSAASGGGAGNLNDKPAIPGTSTVLLSILFKKNKSV